MNEYIINGYNCSVLAYGATGAGKTYTMVGDNQNAGIMNLLMEELFNKIEEKMNIKDYVVKMSYIQVYNQTIRDLIGQREKNLELRDDPIRGTIVVNATEIMVSNIKDINYVL